MNVQPPLLQAFRQPWVLLSILVLLLNDHVLKSSVPSWLANRGQAHQSKSSAAPAAPSKLAYAVLALGAVGSLAFAVTEYPTISSVQRLVVDKTTLYASDVRVTGIFTSRDRGKTWTLESNPSTQIVQALKTPLALPKTLCDPANPQTCYRITDQQQVKESQDSGQTWKTSGQNLPERRSYMIRLVWMDGHAWARMRFFEAPPDYSPYASDMVFLPGEGPSTLMVAMGSEGFLLHAPGQSWRFNPMTIVNPDGSAFYFPTSYPFQAASLSDALSATRQEWLLALGVGVLAYVFFAAVSTKYRAELKDQALFYSRMVDVGVGSLVGLSIGLSFLAWAFGWIVRYESAQATAAALGLFSLIAAFIIRRLLRGLTA